MRHIKPYEFFQIEIEDWVLFKSRYRHYEDMMEFTSNVPGKIIDNVIDKNSFPKEIRYTIKYEYVPDEIKNYFIEGDMLLLYKDEIIAKMTEEEAQMILQSNKYNL